MPFVMNYEVGSTIKVYFIVFGHVLYTYISNIRFSTHIELIYDKYYNKLTIIRHFLFDLEPQVLLNGCVTPKFLHFEFISQTMVLILLLLVLS